MTKLDRAIAGLSKAACGRPFVLVVENAHRAANCSSLRYEYGANMRWHEILGLLEQARIKQERDLNDASRAAEEA